MKSIILLSGATCRPKRLKSVYKKKSELEYYDEIYHIVARLDKNSDINALWSLNPLVVSSVIPSDLAIYNPKIHKLQPCELRIYSRGGEKLFMHFDWDKFVKSVNRQPKNDDAHCINHKICKAISAATGNKTENGEKLDYGKIEWMPY